MRGESCAFRIAAVIRKCFPRHSRPFLPCFPSPPRFRFFFFFFYFVQRVNAFERNEFFVRATINSPYRLTSLADRRRSAETSDSTSRRRRLLLKRGPNSCALQPPPLPLASFAAHRSAIDMEGFFRAASFARLILRSRERNFHQAAAAAGANSHGRSSIAKHPRESAFTSTGCARERERILSFPLFPS